MPAIMPEMQATRASNASNNARKASKGASKKTSTPHRSHRRPTPKKQSKSKRLIHPYEHPILFPTYTQNT